MNCQVENCPNEATYTRTEVMEFNHIDINEKFKTIQLCRIKTPICEAHKQSLECTDITNVSLDTI